MIRVFAAALLLSTAWAAPPTGVVMRVDEGELFLDLGTRDGVRGGATVQVLRRVVLEHPITKKVVEDRFPIGQVKVSEAGVLLSIVRDFKGLARAPKPGDVVVLGGSRPRPEPAAAPTAAMPAAPKLPADEAALDAVLRDNMGHPPEAQATALRAWGAAFPASKHGPAVAAAVARLDGYAEAAVVAAAPVPPEEAPLVFRHEVVGRIEATRALFMAIAIAPVDQVDSVRLLARRKGPDTWTTVPMTRAGDFYWRAPMPPALLAEPGAVKYAIEVTRVGGVIEPLVGDLLEPRALKVEALPAGAAPPGPSHAEVRVRYVDFNLSGEGTDRYVQSEANFSYGVRWRALRTVEVGVGLIDGEGGTVFDLAEGMPSEALTLGYAYAATELGVSRYVGVGARITGGNHRANADGTANSVVGLQGHLRLGDEEGTRLVLGAAALDDLGSRFFADFHVRSFDRLPITASAEATNLPVDADYGLRLTADVGWKVTDVFTLAVEAGWNARTINHYGFTTGLGLALDWE